MPDTWIIDSATVVTPQAVLPETSLRVRDGRIDEIRPGGSFQANGRTIDGRGRHLFPGFIDLHCDAIEKKIEPRPNTFFPLDVAVHELDKQLAACGVTSSYHSLSFAEMEIGLRSNNMAAQIVRDINEMSPGLRVRTRVHARFEITDFGAVPILRKLVEQGQIQLFSIMDHTPGQGQFREVMSFKNYYGPVYAKSDAEMDRLIQRKQEARDNGAREGIAAMVDCCRDHDIALASHDDDCPDKIRWLHGLGIELTEFPVNLAAARSAREHGLHVILGAPNVLRGASQGGNLSAREALAAGCGDILCSDYAPLTLLHAVLTLVRLELMPLPAAVNLVSLRPAQAVGIDDETGALREGLAADLLLLDLAQGFPRILKTFVQGREVFASC
ncbi:MAG: alpha-D-ribose 1-methylphosphonate 5-triphosphate diphosphatase [Desulfobulbaceae bacterium A2]|nr:MAG: alpha-D-ribose 1-methylphosphonate 5-triphosphate diphosphatase [Desulfobulbaceae bacterium A2]